MKRFLGVILCIVGMGLASAGHAQTGQFTQDDIDAAPVCKKGRDVAPGEVQLCTCKKRTTDWFIWGSGPYSGHSDVCTAARHAGVLGEEGGALIVVGREGQSGYEAVERNGISSKKWGRYSNSFDVTPARAQAALAACGSFDVSAAPYQCACPAGSGDSGSVWGTGPYTGDSNLCRAARHAGVIDAAGGAVAVTAEPGQGSYEGSAQNGVKTSAWGSYPDSFMVSVPASLTVGEVCGKLPSTAEPYACDCPAGSATGSVWGSGPYTGDSNICAAATHAGAITAAGGSVRVLVLGGLQSYAGTQSNGVTSADWEGYDRSITFDRN